MAQIEKDLIQKITDQPYSEDEKRRLSEEISVDEYLERLLEDPRPARTAFQRAYDFITAEGSEKFTEFKEGLIRYNFFRDLDEEGNPGRDAIFGLEGSLMRFVNLIKDAAFQYGAEKRILLLHGPVGSSKSTIAKLLKKGFERDSYINPVYSIKWVGLGDMEEFINSGDGFSVDYEGKNVKLFDFECQMHEDPIKLLAPKMRNPFVKEANSRIFAPEKREARDAGEAMRYRLDPDWGTCIHCNFTYNALMQHYGFEWHEVMKHAVVKKLILSEQGRVGIGTFIPADEKNQDITELTGNVNYNILPAVGSDADPRAFNLSGEFCRSNRGVIEFIEMLKLGREFLYPLLEASQDKRIKPKQFSKIPIDEIILGHTNHEEFERLQDDKLQKALRDRTRRIDVPYNLKLKNERLIYGRDYHNVAMDERIVTNGGTNLWKNRSPTVDKHIAPLTIEIPSMWAVLTRLEEPPQINESKDKVSLLQKLYLYDGKRIPQFGEDKVRELRRAAVQEGFEGISPRFIQDCLGYAIASEDSLRCVNPFMVLSAIRTNLRTSTLIASEEERNKYKALIATAEEELYRRTTEHVQMAISADEDELRELASKYIKECSAYTTKEKLQDKWSSRDRGADEPFLRRIEQRIGISDNQKDEFRGKVMQYIGSLHVKGQLFDYKQDADLYKALRVDLYESKKDKLDLANVYGESLSPEEQEKLDVVVKRMKEDFGYCEVCADDALKYVAAEIARGHQAELFI